VVGLFFLFGPVVSVGVYQEGAVDFAGGAVGDGRVDLVDEGEHWPSGAAASDSVRRLEAPERGSSLREPACVGGLVLEALDVSKLLGYDTPTIG